MQSTAPGSTIATLKEFQSHVIGLLSSTERAKIKTNEAWFTAFRNTGLTSWQVCIDILMSDPSNGILGGITLPDRIVASQNIVWFSKRSNIDYDITKVAECLAKNLSFNHNNQFSPVLKQLCLAAAIHSCKLAFNGALSQVHSCLLQATRTSTLQGFFASLASYADATTLLAILSIIPEIVLSKELKLNGILNIDRVVLVSMMLVHETRYVAKQVESLFFDLIRPGSEAPTDIPVYDQFLSFMSPCDASRADSLETILKCVMSWIQLLEEVLSSIPPKVSEESKTIVMHAVEECLNIWINHSQLVKFVMTRLLPPHEYCPSVDVKLILDSKLFGTSCEVG